MNSTLANLIAGTAHFQTPGVDEAIAARFLLIQQAGCLAPHQGGEFCYDGNRCKPESLGWRLVQNYGAPDVAEIEAGALDAEIVATYHEAANAEHWYRFEKDWGDPS